MPVEITKDTLESEVKNSEKPVVLKVYASWCGPCQQMVPIVEQIEKELGDVYKFAKLNVDDERDISIEYGVTSIPTFLFIKENEVKGKETGYMSKEDLKERILHYLS